VATSHTNRPTKLEGLKEHPSSLGRTDAFAQATLLDLYDPDRLDTVRQDGHERDYQALVSALRPVLERIATNQGAGLHLLTETVTSPTFGRQMAQLRERFPQLRWHQYEPANRDNARQGALDAFGVYVQTLYDFKKAALVLSLDADFLCVGPGRVRYAADFADARDADNGAMNRLYVAECAPTLTGANADHRLSQPFSQIETLARALARLLGVSGVEVDAEAVRALPEAWVNAVAQDLRAAGRGRSIVIPGDGQPPAVHALAHVLNDALGNVGETVLYKNPIEVEPTDQTASLRGLVEDAAAGRIELLVILGGNPVYNAPADIDVLGALEALRGKTTVHLTSHFNETSAHCAWAVPEAHFLEAWGDVRGHDGVASIVQPLILPLYPDAKSAHEILALLLGEENAYGLDIVRETWQSTLDDNAWKTALSRGIIQGTAAAAARLPQPPQPPGPHTPPPRSGVDVVFRTDPGVYDGRFANNGWLQELPRPLTKLTWDNAVLLSRATAAKLGVRDEDLVEV
ncbi:MAG TPA: molybdopterin oxidoreductase, partial [Candidatus Hydrogenedentes bacterium]|nr:molybdopterin oxidoreductase [Candidatus Hydrogenedentota bacterium]